MRSRKYHKRMAEPKKKWEYLQLGDWFYVVKFRSLLSLNNNQLYTPVYKDTRIKNWFKESFLFYTCLLLFYMADDISFLPGYLLIVF